MYGGRMWTQETQSDEQILTNQGERWDEMGWEQIRVRLTEVNVRIFHQKISPEDFTQIHQVAQKIHRFSSGILKVH